ncbi:MAG: hypothetical protein R3257_07675, partial [bacterium]|nr:hypothetical protein [bacterium]
YPRSHKPLRLDPEGQRILTNRLGVEVQALLEGGEGRVQVHARSGQALMEQARRNPEAFQGFIASHFHPHERTRLEEGSKPVQERSLKFFSTLGGILASKDAVLDLLKFEGPRPYADIHFRYGRPVVYGEVSRRLGTGNLMTSQTSDGEAGVGLAVWEPRLYASGIASIGIDMTTPRLQRVQEKLGVTPEHHTLAEAAYKATLRYHPIKRFNHYRYQEISKPDETQDRSLFNEVHVFSNGHYLLSGHTAEAAGEWLGPFAKKGNQLVHARNFHGEGAIVGLVAIPVPPFNEGAKLWSVNRKAPPGEYGIDNQGNFRLIAPDQRVVVLGELTAGRGFNLAREGHRPVFIDRDQHFFDMHKKSFRRRNEIDIKKGRLDRELHGEWVFGDWYDTRVEGDAVEAYFPLSVTDIPISQPPLYHLWVADFMKKALHTKLGPRGGSVFVISEVPQIIQSMERQVMKDTQLELVDMKLDDLSPPLRGGHNYDPNMDYGHTNWILYRRKGQ